MNLTSSHMFGFRLLHGLGFDFDSFEHWFEGSYYRVSLYVELGSSIEVRAAALWGVGDQVRVRVRARRVPLEY